ncbi:NAD(P)/FAD-dependent oxidoreductase [Streptomyces sp. NPDC002851]
MNTSPKPQTGSRPDHRTHDRADVLVLGAGYGGLVAALRIAPHARVTLVDPSDRFTERVRLHELAAGRPDVTHPLRPLLERAGVAHIAARATGIDPHARVVTTDDGRDLPYGRLVYALGSRTANSTAPAETAALDSTHPRTRTRAYTAESAAELRKRLQDGPGRLTVVGGGLTGVEMAAELAEAHPEWDVRLLSSRLGESLSAKGRAHVRTTLERLGVTVSLTEDGRPVTSPDEVDADVVVWSASMTPNTELAAAAGLPLDPASGRIPVDATLRTHAYPEIYAVGDAAAVPGPGGRQLRMACATALPTGAHAGASIVASLRGDAARPLRFRYAIQCVSLGRHNGLIQSVRADDTPRELILKGRAAARTKEQVVRSTVRLLRAAAAHPGTLRLLPGVTG